MKNPFVTEAILTVVLIVIGLIVYSFVSVMPVLLTLILLVLGFIVFIIWLSILILIGMFAGWNGIY